MRKIQILLFALLFTQLAQAQVYKTIDRTKPGSTWLTASEKFNVTNLTVIGSINASYVRDMRDNMPQLAVLDISAAVIEASDGTDAGFNVSYPPNQMPEFSFCTRSNYIGKSTLQKVILPNTITSLGDKSFYHCNALSSVTIGLKLDTISNGFQYCSGLTEFIVNDGNKTFSAVDGVLFNKNKTTLCVCPSAKLGSYSIPNSVTSLWYSAFYKCRFLTSITIPNTVKSIPNRAFQLCSGATSITIPNSVTTIDKFAFQECSGLTGITIPNSVTTIGAQAFLSCTGLSGTLTIPNSVTTLGLGAFESCTSLTGVSIGSGVDSIFALAGCSGLTSITFPNTVTTIGSSAFSGCTGLTGILTIPNTVTSVGNDAFYDCHSLTGISIGSGIQSIERYVFAFCNGLTNVTIPNTVTSIGDRAFDNCDYLTTVTIGSGTGWIGSKAFYNCSSLKTIYSLNALPPLTPSDFSTSNTLLTSVTDVFVPTDAAVAAYKAEINWIGPFPGDIIKKGIAGSPILTTTAASAISAATATAGGNITSAGAATITARGVCWSIMANPTTADNKTTNSTGVGVFTSAITGLTSNTTYHIRAYATNSVGTSYGSERTFKTSVKTGVEENLFGNVSIYPNPTNGQLTINLGNENISNFGISICNTLGQRIQFIKVQSNQTTFDLSKYGSQGIYFVQLVNDKGAVIETKKVVLQ